MKYYEMPESVWNDVDDYYSEIDFEISSWIIDNKLRLDYELECINGLRYAVINDKKFTQFLIKFG